MIDSKRIGLFAAVSAAAAVIICVLLIVIAQSPAAETLSVSSEPPYAEKIFGADIITIDIAADESEWQQMLDNAMSEQYIMADVAVNGTKFSNVGIRPKGNNSLQQVASSDSDRYSFKIKFDEYTDGQTCFGLDMLVLNNMLGDATCMKEYTTFDMMREMGVPAPYFGYAVITLNGENRGLYFALEAYSGSFKQRISGDGSGNLYNVKEVSGGGFGQDKNDIGIEELPERQDGEFPENTEDHQARGFGMGGMGASSSGGSLVYTDDNSSSYPAIFGNAVGNGSDEEDYQKAIAALKALNEGENIEQYFDVDEILRYLAVHTVVVNLDSYSSEMAQNYYIYEYEGMLQILPWDYNYAWGAFRSGSSSAVVNFPADTPVSGVEMSERPLISKLFENGEYFERYHKYLSELIENYFKNGNFEKKIDGLDALIGSYVQRDPTAFYTHEEYTTALAAFKNIGNLRAESISGQLDGTVPSTTEGQQAAPDRLIDASSVRLSELGSGSFGGGDGSFGDFGNRDGNRTEISGLPKPDSGNFSADFGNSEAAPQEIPERGETNGPERQPDGFPNVPNGNVPQETPLDFSENENEGNPPQPPDEKFGNGRQFSEGGEFSWRENGEKPENEEMPERGTGNAFPDRFRSDSAPEADGGCLAVTGVCAVVLAAAIFGASLVKRNF